MAELMLDRKEFEDKVYGCWIGKNIGGTLGAPYEGKKHVIGLEFYDPLPSQAAPNDDLDLQLVWLKCLEDSGLNPSVRTLAEYWNRHAYRYPWAEYGFFMRNFSRGLRPPVAGSFENYFVDEMGSPIRSEIWACLHPADPQRAAEMAWRDSAIDHAGGEGTYGEMFWAAVESAAFVESDPLTLIRIGLAMIPPSSQIARVIKEVLFCHKRGWNWGLTREKIATQFGHVQACNAVPNHGFTIIGWLYGQDFGDCLLKAVNCGYDTDCTGATLGAVLGILLGAKQIPEKWRKPVGDAIVLHKYTCLSDAPKDLSELTRRTIALTEKNALGGGLTSFGDRTALPENMRSLLFRNGRAWAALQQDSYAGVELVDDKEVWLHYGGDPVVWPEIAKVLWVSVPDSPCAAVSMSAPVGWGCTVLGGNRFELVPPGDVPGRNRLTVTVDGASVDFVVLGPQEATGYAAGDRVQKCPTCLARVEACMCACVTGEKA